MGPAREQQPQGAGGRGTRSSQGNPRLNQRWQRRYYRRRHLSSRIWRALGTREAGRTDRPVGPG